MSKLELNLEGWGEKNQLTESIDTNAPVSSESKSISRFDGHESGYSYVGTTDYSQEKVFQILNDYFHPDTKTPLDSAVHSILALLPEKEPLSTEVWDVGVVVLQLAEQIPYHHPSQIKLARLMEELTRSPKFTTELSETDVWYMRGQRFKESLRDWYNGPGEDAPQEWPNLNAFFAHEASTHILPHQPDFALWTLRDAFEKPAEPLHWSGSFKGMQNQQIAYSRL
ncbi:hypothetical protein Asppvi_010193 [Aspergillus pseudoviridinutans]|uniref:Uncharacterized protein n=1 Tax=Aspergillus pseudoviridinutans TaxID=1517512 RepID=A0A9P3BLM7_9EURO|nr:uncharacterized protein Asppvi_010193 [Aspergillus pseudoviridinutans]GIJ91228.1 hypothetical protein Asppvi_010193 [Aspergillus pseudoviridinutans]